MSSGPRNPATRHLGHSQRYMGSGPFRSIPMPRTIQSLHVSSYFASRQSLRRAGGLSSPRCRPAWLDAIAIVLSTTSG